MNQEIKQSFYDKLQSDKIKINWNKNPIKMDLFLSFLTIPVVRSYEHYRQFDASNGWGKYKDFVPWLSKYLQACKDYPDANIHVSR